MDEKVDVGRSPRTARDAYVPLLIVGLILLIRVPFLNQAIQGDDVYYLAAAQHAQIEPLHPNNAQVAFLGKMVSMRGHPHPPLNNWTLAGLIALFGDVREVPFHLAYIGFSLIAAFAMWSLAARFSPNPLWATLLFLSAPVFIVNGNSLESDLPFLAFWLASFAFFIKAVDRQSVRLLIASVVCMIVAAMAAPQSVFLVPILAFYLWHKRRGWLWGWLAVLTAPLAFVLWQAWEMYSGGALPAGELAGNLRTYNFQALGKKLRSAIALTVHAGWMIFPPLLWWAFRGVGRIGWALAGVAALGGILIDPSPLFWLCFATGVMTLFWCLRNWREFEAAWILLFFGGAVVIFFAGSARYLLPIAAPLALIASRQTRLLKIGFVSQLAIGLLLAGANYQHWDGYRQFARTLPAESAGKRVWINGEWGLQFYGESRGALVLLEGQAVRPGEYVVSSELGFPAAFTTGGGVLTPVAQQDIRPWLPFRLIGLDSRSAYSTADHGFRAFDVSTAPVDRVRLGIVMERKPTLSDLAMNSPEADSHIVSGIYQLEGGRTRWMSGRAIVLLKRPDAASTLRARFYVPGEAPARAATLLLDGREVGSERWTTGGVRTVQSAFPVPPGQGTATVALILDKSFQIPNDRRDLGAVLIEIGFIAAASR